MARLGYLPRLLLISILVLLVAGLPTVALADEHLERETREIARRLKCPVCQNLSVADSPSPLAGQMRDSIRKQLAEGRSPEEITNYFVARYGEEVLLDPPKAGFSQLLWWGAAIIPLAGLLAVVIHLRRWLRQRTELEAAPAAIPEAEWREYEALLERELERSEGSRA